MLKIGITGGIGSGKSTVCRVFEFLGVPVYSADLRAREITNSNPLVVKAIKRTFGNDLYAKGSLDRKKLGALVFGNPDKLARLNAIVHPAVFKDFADWLKEYTNAPYILKEAALMYESGSFREMDYVINVNSPKKLRIQRVMARDKVTAKEVMARMRNQLSDRERTQRADFIIKNNGIEPLIPQVLALHEMFMEMAGPIK